MTNEIQTVNGAVVKRDFEDYAMTADGVQRQVNLIQEIMRRVMKNGEHYGTIPGCGPKPVLLKPGAEKLCTAFRIAPHFHINKSDTLNGHREYEIVCELKAMHTGVTICEGVGTCSTLEGKYRFRSQTIPTGEEIPKDYKDRKGFYKAKGFVCRKDDSGAWEWCRVERVEHDNPADYYNTVLKIGKKRAMIDAVLTATAASDIFIQDIDEGVEPVDDAGGSESGPGPVPQTPEPQMTDEQKAEAFTRHLKASGFGNEPLMTRFIETTAQNSRKSEQQIKAMAWDEKKRFFAAFEKFKALKTEKSPAPFDPPYTSRPDPMKKDDGAGRRQAALDFANKGEGGTKSDDPNASQNANGVDGAGDSEQADDDENDLYQTDEWLELTAMQAQYPDIYKSEIANASFKLNTLKSVKMAIDKMSAAIEAVADSVDDIPM